MRVLLTGAGGFVGRALLNRLCDAQGVTPIAGLRRADASGRVGSACERFLLGDLAVMPVAASDLRGVDVIVHAAARVHVMHEAEQDPLGAFRAANVAASLSLAEAAAQAGVRRFVFISSIKVNGEGTPVDVPYFADGQSAPADPYGISKMEAEQGLRALAAETGMELVIIRPPLVYGPGVKANFLSMMRWLHKGMPLPLGAIHNRRSLVALDNLVDLIVTCIEHPAAANQIFLVSDGEDLSTSELLRRMGAALGRPARLLPVPSWLLETGAAMLGRKALARRLCGSLQVDIGKTRELLNWYPPLSVDESLRKTAEYFLEYQAK